MRSFPLLYIENCTSPIERQNRGKARQYSDYDLYYMVGYRSGTSWQSTPPGYRHEVKYDKASRTLDFTGAYQGHNLFVMLVGQHQTAGDWVVFTNTCVSNAKLVLTPMSSSSQFGLGATRKSNESMRKSCKIAERSGKIIMTKKIKTR